MHPRQRWRRRRRADQVLRLGPARRPGPDLVGARLVEHAGGAHARRRRVGPWRISSKSRSLRWTASPRSSATSTPRRARPCGRSRMRSARSACWRARCTWTSWRRAWARLARHRSASGVPSAWWRLRWRRSSASASRAASWPLPAPWWRSPPAGAISATRSNRTAGLIGVSTDDLQRYRGAAKLAGVDSAVLTRSLATLGDTLQDAQFGRNPQALIILNRLGISIKRNASGVIDSVPRSRTSRWRSLASQIRACRPSSRAPLGSRTRCRC
jgi:hypothetical protein